MKILTTLFLSIALISCHQQEIAPTTTGQRGLTLDDQRVLILVDGKQVSSETVKAIDPSTIESMEVIKDPKEVKRYTTSLYQGVIKINLKKK